GGMVGPAGLFVLLSLRWGPPELLHGWAIPCACDILFRLFVVRAMLGRQPPAVPFLLMLAIADDALGLIVLAAFYPSGPLRIVQGALLMAPSLGGAGGAPR